MKTRLGAPPPRAWSPPGTYVWDSWFLRHDGRLHVFYLQAPREACAGDPERRHDLAAIGHAVATDDGFLEVAPALAAAGPGSWDDLALWTGSIAPATPFAPFALFYTARRRSDPPLETPHERQRRQRIGVAYSDDLVHWRRSARTLEGPVLDVPGPSSGFDGVAWRDPFVVRGEDGRFHAFLCARLAPGRAPRDAGGAVAHVVGEGPEDWGPPRLFLGSGDFYQLEVPQVFWRRGPRDKRLYLLFSAQRKDCSAERRRRMGEAECRTGTYVLASDPVALDHEGWPTLREPARILAEGIYAGRLVDAESAETPSLFGFPWPAPGETFAGGILGPRALRFAADGALELIGERP